MKPKVFAKYPFIKPSSEFVRGLGVTLEDLIESPNYARAREMALAKIIEAVKGQEPSRRAFSDALSLASANDRSDVVNIINEVLSYIIARIMISCVSDKYLYQWFAHYQALSAYGYLLEEEDEVFTEVGRDLGLEYELEGEAASDGSGAIYSLHFLDYLQFSRNLKSQEWKLVNRDLVSGRVRLQKRHIARLLLEAVRMRVASEFPRPVTDQIEEHFATESKGIHQEIEARKAQFMEFAAGQVELEVFPPCMKVLIGKIGAGENISHEGRFAIVSFAHTIGMTKDDIIKIFSTSPDFDISKSMYQIEHIIGEISDTEYLPPECATMRSFGNCLNQDYLCKRPWMTHPLKYYKSKLKHLKRDNEATGAKKPGMANSAGAARDAGEAGESSDESGGAGKEDAGNASKDAKGGAAGEVSGKAPVGGVPDEGAPGGNMREERGKRPAKAPDSEEESEPEDEGAEE